MGVTWTTNWGGPAFPPCFFFDNDGFRIRTSLVTGVELLDGLGGVRRIWDLLSSLIGERGCSGLFFPQGLPDTPESSFPNPFPPVFVGVYWCLSLYSVFCRIGRVRGVLGEAARRRSSNSRCNLGWSSYSPDSSW